MLFILNFSGQSKVYSKEGFIAMTEKTLKNTSVHYWINDTKADSAIIFLHPAFADHTCFDSQLDYLDSYRVITMDLIGHGKSLGKGTIEETAEYIKQILTSEKIYKINLVGVSLGAVLVQDFANKYPNMVSSLTCIGGYDINNFDENLQKDNTQQQMKMMMKAIFSIKAFAEENKKISAYTKEAQENFYQMNLNFKKSSFRYLASLKNLVNKYQTQKRAYPLLIGVGEYDNDMAKQASAVWHESEPNSEYKVFPDAGHIVNMDTPEKFNKELMKVIR